MFRATRSSYLHFLLCSSALSGHPSSSWIFLGTTMFGIYLLEQHQRFLYLPPKHIKTLNWCLHHCLGDKQRHAGALWIWGVQRNRIKQRELNECETVIVKHIFFWMSLAPWRQANFCCEKPSKHGFHFFVLAFTTVTYHFYRKKWRMCFIRCVSKLQRFSVESWCWGWCTSIATTWSRTVNCGFAITHWHCWENVFTTCIISCSCMTNNFFPAKYTVRVDWHT